MVCFVRLYYMIVSLYFFVCLGCNGECRPRLVQFINCNNVSIHGRLTLLNSPDWTSHYLGCEYLYIDGITVWNDFKWPNGDGIDPDSSRHVIIKNVYVNTGDDGICLKSAGGYGDMYDVDISNCIIRSHSSGIKFGSSTVDTIKDVYIHNITIIDSNRGLGLQMRDSGSIFNITYENINIETKWWDPDLEHGWWGDGDPIWITIMPRNRQQTTVGKIYDIYFKNITIRSENVFLISGFGDELVNNSISSLYNININNLNIIIDKWGYYRHVEKSHDYRPSYINTLPSDIDAIYIEYANNISIKNTDITFYLPDQQKLLERLCSSW